MSLQILSGWGTLLQRHLIRDMAEKGFELFHFWEKITRISRLLPTL